MTNKIPSPLQSFIDHEMANTATRLPGLVLDSPDSFQCGVVIGYRNALIAVERLFDDENN